MTEVSFYILEDTAADAVERFVCRLAEKIQTGGHRAFIHVESADQAERLDALLWTFKQNSFVPHARLEALADDDTRTPIAIGQGDPPARWAEVLVNAGGDVSRFFSRFARHSEIIAADRRDAGRERYRFYKDRGYALTTHRISA